MKRVWTLYRVSTDKQHDGEDIPLQRKACEAFIKKNQEWKLTNEVFEMGVSGYKLIAKDRDEVEFLLRAAENKEFDILLVFMFDRIGRREDDTPILVQTFCKLGVEVWSVKEGERRFDNHIDKLMNYITFWQADGESDKTSKRVTEKIEQMNIEGNFTGGNIPYGYEMFDTGIPHSKYEKSIKDIRINENEAELIKKIFDLALKKGFGSPRIAQWLNENNYKTRNFSSWRHNYIQRILKNTIYIGYKQYGYNNKKNIKHTSTPKIQPFNQKYVILSKDTFELVQQLIDKRGKENKNKNIYINSPTKSEFLLSGIVKCGYCDHNLKTSYSVKTYERKSDSIKTKSKTLRYVCGHGKDRTNSHEAVQFGAKKYEQEVIRIIKDELSYVDKSSYVNGKIDSLASETNLKNMAIRDNQKLLDEAIAELKGIESLIVKIEMGKSKVPMENAENMLIEQNTKIEELKKSLKKIQDDIDGESKQLILFEYVGNELEGWAEKFDKADFDEKKMMLSRILSWVIFKKDKIDLKFIPPLLEVIL